MSRFPKAKPSRPSRAMPKRPRDWRRRRHVCINHGSLDYDDVPLCMECGFRSDHPIHDLTATDGASELTDRMMGEATDA